MVEPTIQASFSVISSCFVVFSDVSVTFMDGLYLLCTYIFIVIAVYQFFFLM